MRDVIETPTGRKISPVISYTCSMPPPPPPGVIFLFTNIADLLKLSISVAGMLRTGGIWKQGAGTVIIEIW